MARILYGNDKFKITDVVLVTKGKFNGRIGYVKEAFNYCDNTDKPDIKL